MEYGGELHGSNFKYLRKSFSNWLLEAVIIFNIQLLPITDKPSLLKLQPRLLLNFSIREFNNSSQREPNINYLKHAGQELTRPIRRCWRFVRKEGERGEPPWTNQVVSKSFIFLGLLATPFISLCSLCRALDIISSKYNLYLLNSTWGGLGTTDKTSCSSLTH